LIQITARAGPAPHSYRDVRDGRRTTMSNGTAEDLKTLRADMANLRADLGKISEALQSLATHGGEEALAKARRTAEKLQGEFKEGTQRVTTEIEKRPLTAVLSAFGVGMLLGMLFHGRRS
jgi:ElaB/YqjD/DUF883 family membrane-anchored ribosome-binding protein